VGDDGSAVVDVERWRDEQDEEDDEDEKRKPRGRQADARRTAVFMTTP